MRSSISGPAGRPSQSLLNLWAFGLSLSWLLPSFSPLWPSFDLEMTCAAVCVCLSVGLALTNRRAWPIPPSAVVVAALAAVPMVQYGSGKILFFGDGWMATLYLLGFALAIATGRQSIRLQKSTNSLFLAIVIASMVSVALETAQWLEIQGLEPWVRDLPKATRPFANLGQPNNLSTLLCWGLLGLWNAFLTRQASGKVMVLCAAYLLFGVALAQSRTAWLVLTCFLAFALIFRRQLEVRKYWIALALLTAFFVLIHLGLNVLGPALGRDPARPLQAQLDGGTRLAHWKSMVAAIGERPWTGWGWEQVSVAQQSLAPSLPAMTELLGYSHNLFLDLLVWNGVPLGVTVIVLMVGWLVVTARRLQAASDVLLLLTIVSVLLHSLLEYPHAYAFFLLPTGLMVGMISNPRSERHELLLPRPWATVIMGLLVTAAAATIADYVNARSNFDTLRFEMARIGPGRNSKPPHLLLLTQLQAVATTDRMPLRENASDGDFELLSKVSQRFPAERTLMQFAVVSAGRGDHRNARFALVRLCKLYPADRCEFAEKAWSNWSTSRYPWLRQVPFPVQDRSN